MAESEPIGSDTVANATKALLESIPSPDFLQKINKIKPVEKGYKMTEHAAAYEAFCKWSSRPKELREPKSQKEFELKWNLPINYTSKWKEREDFYTKKFSYFWKWMYDRFPDVVYSIYRRAVGKSTKDAQVFVDLVGKKLELDRPSAKTVQPLMLIGVPQDRIEKLFVPKGYEELADKTVAVVEGEVEVDAAKPV